MNTTQTISYNIPMRSFASESTESTEVITPMEKEKIWKFLASFEQGQHWDKFPSWDYLQRSKRHHLKRIGIDKPQDRKKILAHIEAWKQEQRWKLMVATKAGERGAKVIEAVHRRKQRDQARLLEALEDRQAHRYAMKTKHDQINSDVKKGIAADKAVRRAERIAEGLPVFTPRFPPNHPLEGESEQNAMAIHAGLAGENAIKNEKANDTSVVLTNLGSRMADLEEQVQILYDIPESARPGDHDELVSDKLNSLVDAQEEVMKYVNIPTLDTFTPEERQAAEEMQLDQLLTLGQVSVAELQDAADKNELPEHLVARLEAFKASGAVPKPFDPKDVEEDIDGDPTL